MDLQILPICRLGYVTSLQMAKSTLTISLFFVLLTGMVLFYSNQLIEDHRGRTLGFFEDHITTAERFVESFIRMKHRNLRKFVLNNIEDVQLLAGGNYTDEQLDGISKAVATEFPEHGFFNAKLTLGDFQPDIFGENLGRMCQEDFANYSSRFEATKEKKDLDAALLETKYLPRLHPLPGHYHFDLVTSWNIQDEKEYGFFMLSYSPRKLVELLQYHSIDNHDILILNRDIPSLIEISQEGSRDELARENYHLTEDELSRLYFRQPIHYSQWDIAYLIDESIFHNYERQIWQKSLSIIGITFIACIVAILYFYRCRKNPSDCA